MSPNNLWVFGYGSLCWNPGFNYSDAHLGYVKGFKRRFWQGNNSHRGTEKRLGRVVTLIEDKSSVVWGKAFKLDDEKASRTYLDTREVALGGYTTVLATFEPLDETVEPFPVLIYIALESNEQYLGKAPYDKMAWDIIRSKGAAGHNLEYLAKLATFMRNNLPEIEDDHLYLLEQICKFILISLDSSLLVHFDSNPVQEKWLDRIQFELNSKYLKKRNSIETTSSSEHSDEETDTTETNNYVCCDLDRSYKKTLVVGDLLSNSFLDSYLFEDECIYLNSNRYFKLQNKDNFKDNYREKLELKKFESYSDFDNQRKWYKYGIKGF